MLFSTWGHRKKKMKKGKGSATNSDRPNHKVTDLPLKRGERLWAGKNGTGKLHIMTVE